MSPPPRLSGRRPMDPPEAKNIQRSSGEKLGPNSERGVLIVGPRFRGCPQGASALVRRVTQMSLNPKPPGRLLTKYKLKPAWVMATSVSGLEEFTVAPRLTGLNQRGSSARMGLDVIRIATPMTRRVRPSRHDIGLAIMRSC